MSLKRLQLRRHGRIRGAGDGLDGDRNDNVRCRHAAWQRGRRQSGSEDQHLSKGQFVRMCNGQERRPAADRAESHCRAPVQPELRRTADAHDLDVAPQHALRVARAERLHPRFLCRKASGKMDGRHPAAHAVRDLLRGENAIEKPIAVAFDDVAHAVDVGGVEPEADNVHVVSRACVQPTVIESWPVIWLETRTSSSLRTPLKGPGAPCAPAGADRGFLGSASDVRGDGSRSDLVNVAKTVRRFRVG